MVGTSRCDVPTRKAGGTKGNPTLALAVPARTARRATPTNLGRQVSTSQPGEPNLTLRCLCSPLFQIPFRNCRLFGRQRGFDGFSQLRRVGLHLGIKALQDFAVTT